MDLEKYSPPEGWSEEAIENYVWRKFPNDMVTSYRLAIRAKSWNLLIATLHGLRLDTAAVTFETLRFDKPEYMCTIGYWLSAPHSQDSVEARARQLAAYVLHQQCKDLTSKQTSSDPIVDLFICDNEVDQAFAIAGWTRVDVRGSS